VFVNIYPAVPDGPKIKLHTLVHFKIVTDFTGLKINPKNFELNLH